MFTGIVKEVGLIEAYDGSSSILWVSCPSFSEQKPKPGASIAINGVCLTVSHFDHAQPDRVGFDLGLETRRVTLLGQKKPGDVVNVEFPLSLGAFLDGHLVQGHIDSIAEVLSIEQLPSKDVLMRFSLPKACAHLVVLKGSIAVNGVSLTVNAVDEKSFFVCLVPHTVATTGFKHNKCGDFVHIETDIIGRYLERLALRYAQQK